MTMKRLKFATLAFALGLTLSLGLAPSCAQRAPLTTAQTPIPAPIQVANGINALAQSVDAATTGLIAARDAGQLSQANLAIAYKVITAISVTGKQLNAELRSPDPWDAQKLKMRQIITAAGISEISKQLPPTARQVMLACITLFNSISAGVGGPVL